MSNQARTITLELLGRVMLDMQVEQREQRSEITDQRAVIDEQRMELIVYGERLDEKEMQLSEQRVDLRDLYSLLLAQVDQRRRAERRISELKDDLELMLKAELMRRLGQFEAKIERHQPTEPDQQTTNRASAYLVACRKIVGKYSRLSHAKNLKQRPI